METVIGLGQAGCNIAERFSQYPQYNIYRIDSEKRSGPKFKHMKSCTSFEEYEASCPSFKTFFKDAKAPYLFIVGGGGTVSGACLRILQQLSSDDIYVLYIKPDISLLSQTKKTQEKIVFNVLQEYARSALLKRMFIVSNSVVEEVVGDVPVTKYYDTINEIISSTIHMLNVFSNTSPIMNTASDPVTTARISTFGLLDIETNEKKIFYPLTMPREMIYYYSVDSEQLETDGTLFKKITEQIKSNDDEKLRVSYGIYSNNYKQNYAYIVQHASMIQEIEI